jgi:SAM-dependent methyltransferase
LARKLTSRILRCRDCGHRWLDLTRDQIADIETFYNAAYIGFREDHKFDRILRQEIRSTIAKVKPPPARILDVGCGNGAFIQAATEAGYDCVGLDVSEAAAELCRSKGLNAQATDFLTTNWPQRFDLITMWDVVEHLLEPEKFLRRAHDLLAEDGNLLLKVPGFGALNFTVLRVLPERAGTLLGAPDHVQYFQRKSLLALTERCGFSPVLWGRNSGLRSRPPTRSAKKRIARAFQSAVGRLAKNESLYCLFGKRAVAEAPVVSESAVRNR